MLTRLAYASKLCSGSVDSEVERIVWKARLINQDLGVTGILAFDGLQIIRLLEGPEQETVRLFERISADERHEDVVPLIREPIRGLYFQRWGMVKVPFIDALKILAMGIDRPRALSQPRAWPSPC